MQQLSALDSITLEAFKAALETCQARGVELPEAIKTVATEPAEHIQELDELSEVDPVFEAFYQAERLAIQQTDATRAKRFFPIGKSHPSAQKLSHPLDITLPDGERPEESSKSNQQEPFSHQTIQPATASSQMDAATAPLKRFILPGDATEEDHQYFQTYIAELKQLNPHWIVTRDRCKTGESDAYIMILNNEDYQLNYAAYIGSNMINDFFSGLKL